MKRTFAYQRACHRGVGILLGLSCVLAAYAAPGQLVIQADAVLEETAFLEIEIAGETAGTQFDQLDVAGDLSLDGELRIVLSNNYFPDPQDTFVVVSAQTLSGTFTNEQAGRVELADGSGSMMITYGATTVTLSDFVSLTLLFRNGFENE
ncbi:MAG: hypothetical protein AAF358_15225 [Pseudomonadota bacterium]